MLNAMFSYKERPEMFRAKLQTRIRSKNESLAELVKDIRKLTRRAYPTASDLNVIKNLAHDHFIDSIPEFETRIKL